MEEATTWINAEDLFQYANVNTKSITPADGSAAPQPPTKKGKFSSTESCGLPSRQQEFNELGAADSRAGCYGCCYIGEQEAGATAHEDVVALMNIIRKCIAKTDLINLSLHLAERYLKIQKDVNSHLLPGEKPLPDWTAASILDHLRNHNTDPELQGWNRMTELQELAQIALNASVVRNPETGQVSIDEKQAKMYLEFVKQMESLSKSDPSKKLYYSGGNHLDPKSLSDGPISWSGKNIMSLWKKRL